MEISDLINNYTKWLNEKITSVQMGDFYEITTPFLDINNDYLQIYVKVSDDTVYFTDDGYTINTLLSCGLSLSGKRKDFLQMIVQQYGLTLEKNFEITARSSVHDFPNVKHLFVQCILKVNDLFMLKQNNKIGKIFLEEVSDFFSRNNIMASEQICLAGKTGFIHSYDFIFPRSKTAPERLCNTMNSPDKIHINNSIFSWLDTKEKRKPDSKLILIVNDTDKKISEDIKTATKNYNIDMIQWSNIDTPDSLNLLAS